MSGGDLRAIEESIERGLAWLTRQQAESSDGGWHPPTYGAMRGGASATSLALFTASELPKKHHSLSVWTKGLAFLLRGLRKRNCIACPDGTLDYPTYSTALTLIATRRLQLPLGDRIRRQLVESLISAQLTEANDFRPNHIDYGGWDLLGGSGASGITSGSNISVSSFAVQALADAGDANAEAAVRRALGWAQRCQNFSPGDANMDGGFYFHPQKDALGNKAEWEDERLTHPLSYGTPTCDGISLMVAAGVEKSEDRLAAAIDWLKGCRDVATVPGFRQTSDEPGWEEGLKYYFFMGLSRLVKLPGKPFEHH
ncbi:MAG: hypothetical protein AAF802_22300, partial [Planctomycetota bacterium]